MQEMNMDEIRFVSGAAAKSGTLTRPTPGESDWGKRANDIASALNAFGSWLGISIFDLTHKVQ